MEKSNINHKVTYHSEKKKHKMKKTHELSTIMHRRRNSRGTGEVSDI